MPAPATDCDQPACAAPRVTLHAVASLDGFIAARDNSLSWLDQPEVAYEAGITLTDDQADGLRSTVDCYVLGARTFELALEIGWPYGDTPVVVVTHRQWPNTRPGVMFYAGDLRELLDAVLKPRFRTIWVVGGAMLCQRFLELHLMDEIRLTIAPVLLGDGLRLFGGGSGSNVGWRLENAAAYRNGYVELHYAKLIGGGPPAAITPP